MDNFIEWCMFLKGTRKQKILGLYTYYIFLEFVVYNII